MRLPGVTLTAAIALLLLAALPVRAADEPEAVYAKFHRATMAGELEEMLRHGPAARRAEIQGMSESSRNAALKMAQFMMPRAFTLERKVVNPNGRAAVLIVSGPGGGGDGKLETIYGTVQMLLESGVWKVDDVSWNAEKPAILATPKSAPAPAAGKAAATAKGGAPVVGSMSSQVTGGGGKLAPAKPECVYKPVMTAQDIQNCK